MVAYVKIVRVKRVKMVQSGYGGQQTGQKNGLVVRWEESKRKQGNSYIFSLSN